MALAPPMSRSAAAPLVQRCSAFESPSPAQATELAAWGLEREAFYEERRARPAREHAGKEGGSPLCGPMPRHRGRTHDSAPLAKLVELARAVSALQGSSLNNRCKGKITGPGFGRRRYFSPKNHRGLPWSGRGEEPVSGGAMLLRRARLASTGTRGNYAVESRDLPEKTAIWRCRVAFGN